MRASRSASPGCRSRCWRFSSARQRQVLLLQRAAQMGRRIEVQNPRLVRADDRSLIQRRQPAVRPVAHAVDRMAAGIGQHHVRRQVLALGAQAVGEPRAQRRPARLRLAGVHVPDRRLVAVDAGVHRADRGRCRRRCSARCGSSSETSVPHWPCLANFHGLPNSFLLARLTKL